MKHKHSNLMNTIRMISIVSLVLLATIIMLFQIFIRTREFNRRAETLRIDYVTQQKELIKREVGRVVETINYQRSLSEQRTKNTIKQQVCIAHAIARNIYQQNKADKTDTEIQQMILDALRPIRFANGSGYFFVIRLDGFVTLNANKPELESKNLLGLQDIHGQYFIKEMIGVAQKSDEGFCEYYWAKPGAQGKGFKKISFIKNFAPFGWLFGAGLYVDDVETQTRGPLMEQINKIRFGENGYLFVVNQQGVLLAHGTQPDLIGVDMWKNVDGKGNKVTQILSAASKKDGGGYVRYWWKRPSTGIESPKIAYARGIPEWKLFVASGVYLNDIEAHIAGLKPALKRELQNYIQVSLLVTVGLIVLFLLLFHFVSRRLLNDFSLFVNFFKQAAHDNYEIDRDQIRFEELHQMAGDANKMLTDKIAAQGKLGQSEEKYRTFFENSSNAMLMIQGEKFIDCNDAAVEMLKCGCREDLLNMHPGELSPELQADGRESSEKAEEMMGIARAKGSNFFEWNHIRKNGKVFPVEVSLTAVSTGDEILLHTIWWDISERKRALEKLQESEERFRDLADMLPEAVFEIDTNMQLTYVNQKAYELFGYTEEDFDRGLDSIDLLVPEDRERARGNLARRLRGEKIGSVEYSALKKDGTSFPILHNIISIIKDREIVGFRGIAVDLTERKQAEEEILKLRKLESLGVLAGGIAHDFNNLLTGLFGNIELAKKFLPADHKSHKFLETAGRSMESATSLTTQMLTFAKGGDPIKETISIGAVIAETAQFSLRGSKVKLQTNITPDLWPVEADKGQLSQVISNLVINAQQAMPEGGTITISAENVANPAGRQVQITVEDEGIGISPQYLDRIFDPYFSTKQRGSGLGLASTHSIITKHNGTINTASILNEGTTFIICLPVAAEEEKTTPEDSLAETYSTPAVAAHILILDDEELVREVIGAMLEELGHKVSYAVHGGEAIKKYQEAWQNNSPYDAVITDLTIPGGMGGQEAAREILQTDPQAKIIVSSGYATDPVMANYKDYGFQGRVVKPYHFAELKKVIERVLMGM